VLINLSIDNLWIFHWNGTELAPQHMLNHSGYSLATLGPFIYFNEPRGPFMDVNEPHGLVNEPWQLTMVDLSGVRPFRMAVLSVYYKLKA